MSITVRFTIVPNEALHLNYVLMHYVPNRVVYEFYKFILSFSIEVW